MVTGGDICLRTDFDDSTEDITGEFVQQTFFTFFFSLLFLISNDAFMLNTISCVYALLNICFPK